MILIYGEELVVSDKRSPILLISIESFSELLFGSDRQFQFGEFFAEKFQGFIFFQVRGEYLQFQDISVSFGEIQAHVDAVPVELQAFPQSGDFDLIS